LKIALRQDSKTWCNKIWCNRILLGNCRNCISTNDIAKHESFLLFGFVTAEME